MAPFVHFSLSLSMSDLRLFLDVPSRSKNNLGNKDDLVRFFLYVWFHQGVSKVSRVFKNNLKIQAWVPECWINGNHETTSGVDGKDENPACNNKGPPKRGLEIHKKDPSVRVGRRLHCERGLFAEGMCRVSNSPWSGLYFGSLESLNSLESLQRVRHLLRSFGAL